MKKRALFFLYTWFHLCCLASNAQKPVVVTTKTPPPEGLVIYDTIQAGWTEAAPGKIPYSYSLLQDNKGAIYSEVNPTPQERRICYLQDGRWITLDDEINKQVVAVLLDRDKNVYAEVKSAGYYKKAGTQWKYAAGDSTSIYSASIQPREKFYGFRKQAGTKKMEWVRWENKSWITMESSAGKLEFDDLPDLVADKKGLVYFATSDNKKEAIVQCLAGKDLKDFAQMPDKIRGLYMDEDDILYVYGGFGKQYIKKWNGTTWTDIPSPAGISSYVNPEIDYRYGKLELTGVSAETTAQNGDRLYFTLQKGNWIRVCSYNIRFNTGPPIISNGILYAVNRATNILSRLETGRIIKREVYPFSLAEGLSGTKEVEESIADLRLIKESGKFGVINRKGETIIYPVIEKIRIARNPNKFFPTGLVFSLLIKGVEYYTAVHQVKKDPARLPGAFDRKSDLCKDCKGTGRLEGATIYETVPGEWVEPTTTTTTRPSTMGGYEKVTVTVPGYRKPPTQKSKGVAPGMACSKCNGKGEFVSGWEEYLEYSDVSKMYLNQRKPIIR